MLKTNVITTGWERQGVGSIGCGGGLVCLRRMRSRRLRDYANGCDAVSGSIGELARYLGVGLSLQGKIWTEKKKRKKDNAGNVCSFFSPPPPHAGALEGGA